MPVRLGTLVEILVASIAIGNDIRVYVFRWRSSLQERLEPLPCPNPDQLAERASLPDVNNDPSIIPSFLTYRCDVNATKATNVFHRFRCELAGVRLFRTRNLWNVVTW